MSPAFKMRSAICPTDIGRRISSLSCFFCGIGRWKLRDQLEWGIILKLEEKHVKER